MKLAKYKIKNYCFDCNRLIDFRAKRCKICSYEFRKGINHQNFIGGKPKCVDCGEQLKSYYSKRCIVCSGIKRRVVKKHCIDCNKELSIPNAKRCRRCHDKYNKGQNHPLYRKPLSKEMRSKLSLAAGGTGVPYENSEYGAEFDNTLKEQVRFRDHYKCQICGCSQLENGKQLDCHHIDYDKKNSILRNLIALCKKCHLKTKRNREYWEKHFKEVISCSMKSK